eukprot:TRINITY_DN12658_c0_g1_i1.p2 TRINITY_DN12658_c0_g1~~TRINITY_DN12658_c0_g1_i1.p2  ORF type:complete len:499 (-),score=104.42 TRINITY_DN12658_c0_g1_i1:2018-3514(-)
MACVVSFLTHLRYVVGIRNLHTQENPTAYCHSSMAMDEILFNTSNSSHVDSRRIEYFWKNVIPFVKKEGWEKEEIQLVWDFVTISKNSSLQAADSIVDDMYSRKEPFKFSIIKVDQERCPSDGGLPPRNGEFFGRKVWGRVEVPNYLANGRGSLLFDADQGKVSSSGFLSHPFLVLLPCSVLYKKEPSFLLQYGHGLFGLRTEILDIYLINMLEDFAWVAVASEFFGMSRYDEPLFLKYLISNWGELKVLSDTICQGFVNLAATLKMMEDENFLIHSSVTVNGKKLIDTNRVGYYGNSLGGILGGSYLSSSQKLIRGVLGVPGSPLSLIMSRSSDFGAWKLLLEKLVFYNWRSARIGLALLQTLMDVADSSGRLDELVQKNKSVLIQDVLGDPEVTPLAAHIMARSYNASTVHPQTRTIFGVTERVPPFSGSAIVEWKFDDIPPAPQENVPPLHKPYNPHECPRRMIPAQKQMKTFLETGIIENYCAGKCEKTSCLTT